MMNTPNRSLTAYLRDHVAKGITHYALAAHKDATTGDIEFYIHPASVSGETADFVATEDPQNPLFDFIFNKLAAPDQMQIDAAARAIVEAHRPPP